MKKIVRSAIILASVVAFTGTAFAGSRNVSRAYGGFTDDLHGVQAAKAGVLYPLKTTGGCGPGFYQDKGQPGDETCFHHNGRLRCPNVCRPEVR